MKHDENYEGAYNCKPKLSLYGWYMTLRFTSKRGWLYMHVGISHKKPTCFAGLLAIEQSIEFYQL